MHMILTVRLAGSNKTWVEEHMRGCPVMQGTHEGSQGHHTFWKECRECTAQWPSLQQQIGIPQSLQRICQSHTLRALMCSTLEFHDKCCSLGGSMMHPDANIPCKHRSNHSTGISVPSIAKVWCLKGEDFNNSAFITVRSSIQPF